MRLVDDEDLARPVDDDRSRADRGRRLPGELTGQLPAFLRDLLPGEADAPADADTAPPLDEEQQEVADALADLGVDAAEAADAVRTGRVPLAIARHRRRERGRYTLDELASRSGIPADLIRELHVAMGLPMRERFAKSDLQWARNTRRFLDVMSVEALIRLARVRGSALSAVARADLAMIREELLLPMRQAGADDLTMAVALAESAEALEDIARQALVHSYELQLDHQLDGELVAMAARSEREEVDIAVGFLDVEGYTALSARIDPAGLDAVIEAFERRVLGITSDLPGVIPVKYLGDAVMLVSADANELADAMLTLTEPVEELADAPLRGGLAAGSVLVREGDYFGTPVNLAARLTDHARAWRVLADDDLADVLGGRFLLKAVRPVKIRGVGTRRPLAVVGRRDPEA